MTPTEQKLADALTKANAWIEEAKPLLKRGGEDTRRLDWIEQQCTRGEITIGITEDGASMVTVRDRISTGNELRDAIDEASGN